jgi:hypothetical protein
MQNFYSYQCSILIFGTQLGGGRKGEVYPTVPNTLAPTLFRSSLNIGYFNSLICDVENALPAIHLRGMKALEDLS